jgi:ribosomal protein S12 methylthiotransferase accessory factor
LRARSLAATDRVLTAALGRFGVVRVANITRLDEVGLPTVSVVRRDPIGESVSVASGKGPTVLAARVAALAEALERYCAEPRGRLEVSSARCDELAGPYLDPRSLSLPSAFDRSSTLEWCRGTTLAGAPLWVPANAVMFPYLPGPGVVRLFAAHTHGLSAGSTRTEAMVHGLLECIERDAYSRGVALASTGRGHLVPVLASNAVHAEAAERLAGMETAGLRILVRDLTCDTGVPTILCTITDHELSHLGVAAHPDGSHALASAIDEAAQSRLVDLQGAREDLPARGGPPAAAWFTEAGAAAAVDVPPRSVTTDLDAALRWLQARLASVGVDPVVVDLDLAEVDMAVVRVITPGLEVWAFDPARIGRRALAWLSP